MQRGSPDSSSFFFFNDTATTEIYTLSLHDALPICRHPRLFQAGQGRRQMAHLPGAGGSAARNGYPHLGGTSTSARKVSHLTRSEEHTSELQSLAYLVCRLLLEKKKKTTQRVAH